MQEREEKMMEEKKESTLEGMSTPLTVEQKLALEEGRAVIGVDGKLSYAISFQPKAERTIGTQDAAARLLCEGRQVLDPPSKRSVWTRSRIVIDEQGMPQGLLTLLAKQKFGTWEDGQYPYWKDKDHLHEALDNIELASHASQNKDRRANQYGAPAGTKEYWRAYRQHNKDRLKQYHRTRRASLRAEREELKRIKGEGKTGTPENPATVLSDRLDDIFDTIRKSNH